MPSGRTIVLGTSAFLLSGVFAPDLRAQILDHFNPLSANRNGIHLYGASISGMYSNGTGGGFGLGIPTQPGASNRIISIQGSASFGWSRMFERSSVSVSYAPSYVIGLSGVDFSSSNHALSASIGRKFGAKWSVGGSANGVVSDFNRLLFAGNRYTRMVSAPATSDELAAALLTGSSTNFALSQVVSAPPLIESPETAFQYGGRMSSASGAISAAYAHSSRSTYSLSMTAGRSQFFNHGNDRVEPGAATVQRTTMAGANLSWAYSLTPRTNFGANLSTNRNFSTFQDAYGNQAGLSLGRTITRNWFAHGTAGVGWIKPVRQTFQPTQRPQLTYGFSTGTKLYAQTLVASFSRSISDMYGLGADASENAGGAWSWKRPGTSFSVTSGFGYSRLISKAFPNTRSWNAFTSFGKSLNAHLAMSVSYAYVQFPLAVLSSSLSRSQSGVMCSVSWSPSVRR